MKKKRTMKTLRQQQYQYNKSLKKSYEKTNKSISFQQYKERMKNEALIQKVIKEETAKAKRKGTYSDKNKWSIEEKARKRFELGGDLATKKARESYFKKKQKSIISPTNRKKAEERLLYTNKSTLMSENDILKHRIISKQMNQKAKKEFNKFLKKEKTNLSNITIKKKNKDNVKEITGLSKHEYEVFDQKGNLLGSFRYRDNKENNAIDSNKYIIDDNDDTFEVDEDIDNALEEEEEEEEEEGVDQEYQVKNSLVFGTYKKNKSFRNKVRALENEQFK